MHPAAASHHAGVGEMVESIHGRELTASRRPGAWAIRALGLGATALLVVAWGAPAFACDTPPSGPGNVTVSGATEWCVDVTIDGDLTVSGTLTMVGARKMTVLGDATINGTIDADGQGGSPSAGSGAGNDSTTGAGAGHGGDGGNSSQTTRGTYRDSSHLPTATGAGGGNGNYGVGGSPGGAGGGMVWLDGDQVEVGAFSSSTMSTGRREAPSITVAASRFIGG